jgi:hypothetical protein
MSVYLKIHKLCKFTENAQKIYQGQCSGRLESVPADNNLKPFIKDVLTNKKVENRIFICDSLKSVLGELIPKASGFIFKEGSTLNHLANKLRHHRIPACIDSSLWFFAQQALKLANTPLSAELICGNSTDYSPVIIADYNLKLKKFHQTLQNNPMRLSIYDLKRRKFLSGKEADLGSPGLKTLSINSLYTKEYLIPKTLILAGFRSISKEDQRINQIKSFLSKHFPLLTGDDKFNLMVRASIHRKQQSKTIVSGMIPTVTVKTYPELSEHLQKIHTHWKNLDQHEQTPLTIILQEKILTSISGIVFTRLPWDYHAKKLICDLTFYNPGKLTSPTIQIKINECDIIPSLENKENLIKNLSLIFAEEHGMDLDEKFYSSFLAFLLDSQSLQKSYRIPLDIEFAVTKDFKFYFTQFRHIFNL